MTDPDQHPVGKMLRDLEAAMVCVDAERRHEDRATLAGAHREIARLRNALQAARNQAKLMLADDGRRGLGRPSTPSPHTVRAEYIVDLADAALKDAA